MFKKIALIACMSITLGACSSGSSTSSTPITPDPGGNPPDGSTTGVWFGSTGFGETVLIVGASGEVNGSSSNGAGEFEAVFGNAGSPMDRFIHFNSDNPASATSFRLAGDLQPASQTYNLTTTNDGQQLNNTGDAGNFSLTFATTNDVGAIDAASIAGTWVALTSFCPVDCNVSVTMNFAASGAITGSTQYNAFDPIPITGTASNSGSNQYLNVSFSWNGQQRDGVLYRDRTSNRLVLNTTGADVNAAGEPINSSFSGYLTQQ